MQFPNSHCMGLVESDYRSYQQRGVRFQTPTQHQTLSNDHSIGLTEWYAGPTPCGTVNIGVYIPAIARCDNTSRSSAQPNMQSHANVTTSMVKAFQQQAFLGNTLMSLPVILEEKNSFDPWVPAVENAAKLSH